MFGITTLNTINYLAADKIRQSLKFPLKNKSLMMCE